MVYGIGSGVLTVLHIIIIPFVVWDVNRILRVWGVKFGGVVAKWGVVWYNGGIVVEGG